MFYGDLYLYRLIFFEMYLFTLRTIGLNYNISNENIASNTCIKPSKAKPNLNIF
jgi:hypothetical protein